MRVNYYLVVISFHKEINKQKKLVPSLLVKLLVLCIVEILSSSRKLTLNFCYKSKAVNDSCLHQKLT